MGKAQWNVIGVKQRRPQRMQRQIITNRGLAVRRDMLCRIVILSYMLRMDIMESVRGMSRVQALHWADSMRRKTMNQQSVSQWEIIKTFELRPVAVEWLILNIVHFLYLTLCDQMVFYINFEHLLSFKTRFLF